MIVIKELHRLQVLQLFSHWSVALTEENLQPVALIACEPIEGEITTRMQLIVREDVGAEDKAATVAMLRFIADQIESGTAERREEFVDV